MVVVQAEDKFAESLHLAQMGMYNIMENDVEQVFQVPFVVGGESQPSTVS